MTTMFRSVAIKFRHLRKFSALQWHVQQQPMSNDGTVTKLTEGETKIEGVLKRSFPQATYIRVEDISGGCGSMYDIQVESPEFKGKRTVLQHRLVNEALKEEIKDMHGLRIATKAPDSS